MVKRTLFILSVVFALTVCGQQQDFEHEVSFLQDNGAVNLNLSQIIYLNKQ